MSGGLWDEVSALIGRGHGERGTDRRCAKVVKFNSLGSFLISHSASRREGLRGFSCLGLGKDRPSTEDTQERRVGKM